MNFPFKFPIQIKPGMLIFIAYGLLNDRKHCNSDCCKTGECENWTVKALTRLLGLEGRYLVLFVVLL